MKYFDRGKTQSMYGPEGIILDANIFSIAKFNDEVIFREECDGYFSKKYTKEQAIELLEEAIMWVKYKNERF